MTETLVVRRLLVPTDFSAHATAAVRYASLLASRFGADVTLLHATTFRPTSIPLPVEAGAGGGGALVQTYDDHDRLLLDALERTRAQHLQHVRTTTRIVDGEAADAILAATRDGADMIVMGTHGRGGLARAILGSVAEDVIRGSDVPVLTVRNTAPEAITRVLCAIDRSAAAKALRHALLFASAFDAELVTLEIQQNDHASQLREYARTHGVDLVVSGATTNALTRHAPCPVLTVSTGTVQSPPVERCA